MDGAVNIPIGRNLVILAIEREFEEVHQVALEFFFRIDDGNLLKVVAELGFKVVKDGPGHRDLTVCLIQGLGYS